MLTKENLLQAILDFNSKSLFDAGINLFNTLGYNTSLQAPLKEKNYNEFKELYLSDKSQNNESFSEEKAHTLEWKSIDILFQLTDDSFTNQQNLFKSELDKNYLQSYLCFAIELSQAEYSKSTLAQISRQINKIFLMPIILIFRYGNVISLSVINRRINKKDNSKDVLEKVTLIKDINIAKPHRAHIEILFDMNFENLNTKTSITNFDTLHKAWTEVLDIELVTKKFFKQLFEWYEWVVNSENVHFPENATKNEKKDVAIIRLLTRLLFVWFIKQKDLVPENLFDEKHILQILKDFNPISQTNGDYYNAILQNLFFATLNRQIQDENGNTRGFATAIGRHDIKNLYRYEDLFTIDKNEVIREFSTIPFLNGGLFECLDVDKTQDGKDACYIDGFSRNNSKTKEGYYRNRATIPNVFFFDKTKGLFTLLHNYNWTVEENTPLDVQVALDPELLGKVFENLLGTYNPETKESARKDSGSFYTPREIVNYMVDESLKNYLENCLPQYKDIIHTLFNNEVESLSLKGEVKESLTVTLKQVKALDPACGSGAFPMGLLNRLVELLLKLEPTQNIHELKLKIIENCIYGVDIQSIAVQIAKLRFFISLICDCQKDETKENFGIPTLPNLETKFVCANSLIGSEINKYTDDWTQNELLTNKKNELSKIRSLHLKASNAHEKIEYRKKDEELRKELSEEIIKTVQTPNKEEIEIKTKEIERLNQEYLKVKDEFLVEEGEPQSDLFGDTSKDKLFTYDKNKEQREKILKQINQFKKQIEKEQTKSIPQGFIAAIETLVTWNPYDQNTCADFFDADWMFGITDGFDIVIGNPPYVQLQNNGGALAKQFEKCNYKTFTRTGDIYQLFYEKGINLLAQKGHLCFITSNKWMRAGYGEVSRIFFAENTNPILLVDFAGTKIFESATVDTNILILQKAKNQGKTKCCTTKKMNKTDLNNLSNFVKTEKTICSFNNNGESWVILSPIEQSIKNKIEKIGTPLKDWDIQINYGIKTGFNDAFIITTEKRNEILENCKNDEEKKKTAELIRPILRGRDIKRYGYDWADLWLINTHNGIKGKIPRIDINDYPAIKNHLDQYWDKIEKRADQGDTPYNLRNCAYMEDFLKPKIVYPETTQGAFFALDDKNFFIDKTCFMLISDNTEYLQKTLSSNLFEFAYKRIFSSVELGENGYQYNKHALIKLPIKLPSKNEIDFFKNEKDEELINRKVYELYGLSKEEINFIEKA